MIATCRASELRHAATYSLELDFFMKGSRLLFMGKHSCHVHCDCCSGNNLPVGRQIAQVSRVYLQTASSDCNAEERAVAVRTLISVSK